MDNKITLKAKELIFREGEEATRLYLVESGEVMCLKASKDRLMPIFIARAGDIVGENAMLDGSTYSYAAIANQYSTVIPILSCNLKQVLDQGPMWLRELASVMISRFHNTANLIAENRVVHSSIVAEEDFPSSLEVEFKKIIKEI